MRQTNDRYRIFYSALCASINQHMIQHDKMKALLFGSSVSRSKAGLGTTMRWIRWRTRHGGTLGALLTDVLARNSANANLAACARTRKTRRPDGIS
jgi:hypothetical protein